MTEKAEALPKYLNTQIVPKRGLTEKTLQFWKILSACTNKGDPKFDLFYYSPYYIKEKNLENKTYVTYNTGNVEHLFGKDKFSAGSAEAITITEGEYDAASVWQMLGSKYPVVSVRSSSTAEIDCTNEFEYLNSFKRIYLCLDADGPGQKATKKIAKLFDPNKIFYVKISKYKDANEYLKNNAIEEFKRIWWNSTIYIPEGVVSSNEDFKKILRETTNTESFPFPWKSWNDKLYGIRSQEINLITALEGVGKTAIVREIEYKLLKETDWNIGVIHLEEPKKRTLKGYVGLEIKRPIHLPEHQISVEEEESILFNLLKTDNRLHLYTHFGSENPQDFLDKVRYLVAVAKCRVIIIDHITMLVTGLNEDRERQVLDMLSTQLGMLFNNYDSSLVLVSHVNDNNQTRGSRNISKVAHQWIHLSRNVESEDESEKNTTYPMIKKNRFSGLTGSLNDLYFDHKTYSIEELNKSSFNAKEKKEWSKAEAILSKAS